jgi:hypothetical protein
MWLIIAIIEYKSAICTSITNKSRRNLKQKQSIKGITDLLDEDDENYFIRKKHY